MIICLHFNTLERNTSEKLQTFHPSSGIKKFNFLLVKIKSIIKKKYYSEYLGILCIYYIEYNTL